MKSLYKKEAIGGSVGFFDLEILANMKDMPDTKDRRIQDAVYRAAEEIEQVLIEVSLESNIEARLRRKAERQEILALFKTVVFVEEIPNGYCSRGCCKHLPWFIVTTPVGRFRIGWRRRVILIDWEQTVRTKTSEELFAAEKVTKDQKMIHAWNLKDAARYIEVIVASVAADEAPTIDELDNPEDPLNKAHPVKDPSEKTQDI